MEIILTSVVAFVSTNIDDIFLLTLFYGNKNFKEKEVIAGQFFGIIALIIVSLIGSLAGLFIDPAIIGLLGIIPIILGIKAIRELLKNKAESEHDLVIVSTGRKNNVLAVASVTFANGGDNIGIYIPLFAALAWRDKGVMVLIFLIMTFLWCLIAKYFTRHPSVASVIEKHGHRIMPFVLILLGFYILYESNSWRLLSGFFS